MLSSHCLAGTVYIAENQAQNLVPLESLRQLPSRSKWWELEAREAERRGWREQEAPPRWWCWWRWLPSSAARGRSCGTGSTSTAAHARSRS
uniref:Uncharacterized protein n=1 Tax=Arundo donax TaxID=35708 RepID=A0A0A9DLQ2_ARUDO